MALPIPKKRQLSVDPSKNLNRWYIYPEAIGGKFRGFEDRDDSSQLRGAFVLGQNVKFGGASLPAIRDGYEVIGTKNTDATPVKRAWVFESREGDIWELKAYDTGVYYWLQGTSTDWALLKGGFTAGLEFGFGNIGETGGEFHTFFCNGTDEWFQFNGAYATLASTTANTITKSGATAWSALGVPFYTAGTRSVIINGTEYTYTGGEGTATLTGVTPNPTGEAAGSLIVQSPRSVAALTNYKSSIVMAHDGRLHARLESDKSTWDYSKLDDPDDFTAGATDGDGGSKDIEFSGKITAFGKLFQKILCFKRGIIKTLDFVQSGDRIDVPRYTTLTQTDDKSTTLGAMNQRSTFSTPSGMVFVTQDKRMILLMGTTENNEPRYVVISDPIQPIFDAGVHDEGCGICVDNIIWYAFKADENSSANDTVIRGDLNGVSTDRGGNLLPIRWDAPYVGWSVNDWTSVYNSTTGKNEVHWHSSLNSNSFKVLPDQHSDDTNPFTTTIRTWAEHFDAPNKQKRIDAGFVEVRMSENTSILATLLYDEDGVTQQLEKTLAGTDTAKRLSSVVYNPFGASPFGFQKFGSNESVESLPRYIFDLEIPPNVYFFTISLQLSTDEEGQEFELIRFGYRLVEITERNDQIYLI